VREPIGDVLHCADIFAVLSPQEREALCQDVEAISLPEGRDVITQGDIGNSLFIVTSGQLSVLIRDGAADVHVGTLFEGDFFGEMSLLTGTPRTATVVTSTPATIIEITKTSLAPLMQAHGELASLMGSALSERQSSNLKMLMEYEHSIDEIEQETAAAQFTFRIKNFFEIPTSIWGKAVGGLSGFSLGGAIGFAMGGKYNEPSGASSTNADRQIAFTTAIVVLAAKMAASGGSYSQREISLLKEAFDIPAGDMPNVTRIYNRAQGSPKGFEPYALQISDLFKDQINVLEELTGTLIRIAHSAHSGTTEMLGFAEQVSRIFGFSRDEFDRLKTINAQNTNPDAGVSATDYLSVLCISHDATSAEAKKTYHKLVMENHPDKLISDGMPEEFIEQANKKLAMINIAYEQYRLSQKTI
jgi:DnaJ like chaperone protein